SSATAMMAPQITGRMNGLMMSYVNISNTKIKPIRIADSTMLLMKSLLSFLSDCLSIFVYLMINVGTDET
ncbi:hypothetical protein D049_0335B, partial [Vibrio parahaemolyticus VPTS-2010]